MVEKCDITSTILIHGSSAESVYPTQVKTIGFRVGWHIEGFFWRSVTIYHNLKLVEQSSWGAGIDQVHRGSVKAIDGF